jgi:hypothetical protein
MTRRELLISALGWTAVAGASEWILGGQGKPTEPDLAALAGSGKLNVFNRVASRFADGARQGVRMSEAASDGVAYVPGVQFANGTIDIDIRGKDVQQQSFVGIAFHGVDGTTYDAVYFRPFNFRTDDQARRIRAVQYVSHPDYPWQKLRTDTPGKYEKGINPPPDPNGWFHARIVVASPKVSVFVDNATDPSLVIEQLSSRRSGLVGVWVGNTSGGDFANLRITPA